ncbi:MAG: hypothetical protein Q4E37_05525 [Tissierellia bacterium]|nr:hypothetical protein [Tissierellia bacterium]
MKERLKTSLIILLFCCLTFMASQIWLVGPRQEAFLEPVTPKPTRDEEPLEEFLSPRRALLNFGNQEHTLVYDAQEIWAGYYPILKQSFDLGEENLAPSWEGISWEAYMDLQNEPSLVFKMENPYHGRLLGELLGLSDLSWGPLKEVYFPVDGAYFILVTEGGQARVRLEDRSMQDMTRYLQSVYKEASYVSYGSLWEAYGQAKQAYFPKEAQPAPVQPIYQDETDFLSPEYAMDLAQRFLARPLEDIQIIGEREANLYVYGQKSLRLSRWGHLDYQDASPVASDSQIEDLDALYLALRFIGNKVGITQGLVLDQIKKDQGAWILTFNKKEGGWVVKPLEEGAYLRLKIRNNQVQSFSMTYRVHSEEGAPGPETDQVLPAFMDLVEARLASGDPFPGQGLSLEEFMGGLDQVDLVYLDPTEIDRAPLQMAYEVHWQGQVFYMDPQGGQVIERGDPDGLV